MAKELKKYEVEVQHPRHPNRWYDLEEADDWDAEYFAKWEYEREFPGVDKHELTVYIKKKG